MNMFTGLTGDLQKERASLQAFLEPIHRYPEAFDYDPNVAGPDARAMTSASLCLDCREPMVNCFCFTTKPKKKR